MDDLITWLRAQLDEDERGAAGSGIVAWLTFRNGDGSMGYTTVAATTVEAPDHWVMDGREARGWAEARVIYDERRVLAEVEAKRRILDAVERYLNPHPGQPCTNLDEDGERTWEACDLHVERMRTAITPFVLPLLALPLAGREGYREAWRP